MTQDRLLDLIDPVLRAGGSLAERGEEFLSPPLDVVRYHRRPVRWNVIPVLGRALSVTAVIRQPLDVEFSGPGCLECLKRVAMAADGRFSPWKGLTIGLTVLVLTPEPIGAGDETILAKALESPLRRFRVVPFGLIRVNLVQEGLAFALRAGPGGLFPEPVLLADALSEHLRRFVPLIPT